MYQELIEEQQIDLSALTVEDLFKNIHLTYGKLYVAVALAKENDTEINPNDFKMFNILKNIIENQESQEQIVEKCKELKENDYIMLNINKEEVFLSLSKRGFNLGIQDELLGKGGFNRVSEMKFVRSSTPPKVFREPIDKTQRPKMNPIEKEVDTISIRRGEDFSILLKGEPVQKRQFTELEFLFYIEQCMKILICYAYKNILHTDIKSANVIIIDTDNVNFDTHTSDDKTFQAILDESGMTEILTKTFNEIPKDKRFEVHLIDTDGVRKVQDNEDQELEMFSLIYTIKNEKGKIFASRASDIYAILLTILIIYRGQKNINNKCLDFMTLFAFFASNKPIQREESIAFLLSVPIFISKNPTIKRTVFEDIMDLFEKQKVKISESITINYKYKNEIAAIDIYVDQIYEKFTADRQTLQMLKEEITSKENILRDLKEQTVNIIQSEEEITSKDNILRDLKEQADIDKKITQLEQKIANQKDTLTDLEQQINVNVKLYDDILMLREENVVQFDESKEIAYETHNTTFQIIGAACEYETRKYKKNKELFETIYKQNLLLVKKILKTESSLYSKIEKEDIKKNKLGIK